MTDADVLVAGIGAAGLTVAEVLRRKGFTGKLRLVGAESHPPYDRPPLSKEVLTGAWPPQRARLRDESRLAALEADWLLGRRAVRLDARRHRVWLDDGRELSYGTLVIATGVEPRRLPGQPELAGVSTFRTLDDAIRLRRELGVAEPDDGAAGVGTASRAAEDMAAGARSAARRVVIVGAGVLGCEIAAAATGLGHTVTLVEPGPVPMLRQLGAELGQRVADLHRDRGVALWPGVGVTDFLGTDRVEAVSLSDGTTIPADLVVVTAGAAPATDWLADSGLSLADGVECDASGRAAADVYAVGDVARWRCADGSRRLETRTNAGEQAMAVAAAILGEPPRPTPIPYFWSDQYDVKLQVFGVIGADAKLRVTEGSLAQDRFVAVSEADGVVTAAIGWNHPKGARLARAQVSG